MGNPGRGAIHAFQLMMFGILEHGLPDRLGVAKQNGVGMFEAFIRDQGRMNAAHDDGDSTSAILGRDFVGTLCRVGFDGDGDQVGWLVERNAFHSIVKEANGMMRRRQGSQHTDL